MPSVTVRPVAPEDGEALLRLVRGLAEYEKLAPPDGEGEGRLLADLRADSPRIWGLIAEVDGRAVGYVIYFESYSTFRARPKIYIEDIFVEPGARSTGAGFALFRTVAREAERRDCCGIEWEVLDWNQLAIDFYERLGARRQKMWLPYYIDRASYQELIGD